MARAHKLCNRETWATAAVEAVEEEVVAVGSGGQDTKEKREHSRGRKCPHPQQRGNSGGNNDDEP